MGDLGSIPGLGRSPGEGNGCPLQYSGLEYSTDCIVHVIAESDMTEDFHFHKQIIIYFVKVCFKKKNWLHWVLAVAHGI